MTFQLGSNTVSSLRVTASLFMLGSGFSPSSRFFTRIILQFPARHQEQNRDGGIKVKKKKELDIYLWTVVLMNTSLPVSPNKLLFATLWKLSTVCILQLVILIVFHRLFTAILLSHLRVFFLIKRCPKSHVNGHSEKGFIKCLYGPSESQPKVFKNSEQDSLTPYWTWVILKFNLWKQNFLLCHKFYVIEFLSQVVL